MFEHTIDALAVSLAPGRLRFTAVSRLQALERPAGAPPFTARTAFAALGGDPDEAAALAASLTHVAARVLERATARGLRAVPLGHPDYPPLLARLADAPAVLWVRGEAAALALPAVAVVGSRAASPEGLRAARILGEDLAAAGVLVVSGLARGVDAAAHEGALVSGRTVAVLGCGVDVAYPAEHADLSSRVAGTGAVVAEFPPGTAPRAHHFPLRNRIISGLSLATVVVEAAERSGALITARTALDQGREVMAMPAAVAGGRNRGAHGLIRDGALLVESAADVLDALRLLPRADPGPSSVPPATAPDDEILRALTPGVAEAVDALAARTAWAVPALLARLATLEIDGWIERLPGGRILRVARKW
jgi:DNA processing protein